MTAFLQHATHFVARRVIPICMFLFIAASTLLAQQNFDRKPISAVKAVFTEKKEDPAASEYFEKVAREALGSTYTAVRIRGALQALYDTGRIESASVEAVSDDKSVSVTFVLKRKSVVRKIGVLIGRTNGRPVTADEILIRLNTLSPGASFTQQTINANIGGIIAFLFEHGYFNASVSCEQRTSADSTETELIFKVEPGDQAKVGAFKIEMDGFDAKKLLRATKLKSGSLFSREELRNDVDRIKSVLRDANHLSARFEEPNPVLDRDTNTVEIVIKGTVGPVIDVKVESGERELDSKGLVKILPIKREGTIDYSAIVEGERKLEERFQQEGYFFADVKALCSVDPKFGDTDASYTTNDTELLCSALSGADIASRKVTVRYVADLGRQLKLIDIRITGLEDFLVDEGEICRKGDGGDDKGRVVPLDEIRALLGSTKASLIGVIPYLGYGRGYTSDKLLAEDEETIRSLLNELGYRSAKVSALQGISLTGESLIITFDVDAGPRTRIAAVEMRGNTAISTDTLKAQLGTELSALEGKGYSRALVRNVAKKLSEFYSREGFYEARVNYSIENVAKAGTDDVRLIFTVEDEGKPVVINRILVTGNDKVSRATILNSMNLKEGQLLRSTDVFSSEQNLYASDMFRRVEIKPESIGDNGKGQRVADVGVNLEEQAPRTITYGGGYSTDAGPFGAVDLRHYNLFGKLQQGGVRARISGLRQLLQIDFINPRFLKDGKNPDRTPRFAPLTISAQFQRDTTVTRFFRSAFDKGTFGVVQRIDANGNPIDEFGRDVGSPTINRLLVSAETSRTLSVNNRTILFARYRYEDVRLSNIDSLLIKDLLSPDSRVRISGFGVNLVRDTRENCRLRYSLVEIAAKGSSIARCRYNPGDATKGDYLTAEYTVSVPGLGANIGFQKLQASYNVYYSPRGLRQTTLAGRAVLGVATLFGRDGRPGNPSQPELESMLPISERFFAGGSQSLRGFDFESAGPRVAVVPQGVFRNSKGQIVRINPFTVPYGGNAFAMLNLEARIPVSESVRLVPFYDGGNVFRTAGEIFKRPSVAPGNLFGQNLKAEWTNTLGFGFRLKTPVGGEIAVDYGYLLKPPSFQIPQTAGPNGIYTLHHGQIHFRFAQAF